MEIQEIRGFDVPNVFSLREPIVKMQVKLGELADIPTKDIGNINERIIELFPGIKDHKCSTGYVGGFVDRLKEGTYLAHVMEHLCLELQRMLGYDIKHGKARQVQNDIYNVIFACSHTAVGKACGNLVFNTLNDLVNGKDIDIEDRLKELRRLCLKYDQGVSTGAIINEAKRRGIPVSTVNDGEIARLGYGKYQKYISATLYEGTSGIAVDIACNKQLAKAILEEAGIPVPKGRICLSKEEAVEAAREIGYPVVVKPKAGNKGKDVFLEIYGDGDLEKAFSQAKTFDGEAIVEKFIEGRDYRILIVDGKMVAAAERIPAHITGDGIHTVQELIEIENSDEARGEDHEKPLTKIKIDEYVIRKLGKQGLEITDVPEPNKIVWLRDNANLSTGGKAVDCTDRVHPRNKDVAEQAAKAVGLHIAGIDMVIPDISIPMQECEGVIVEINAAPGIRIHLNPAQGQKRDVAAPILDMIYPGGTPFSIPIVSITGTNGKTTTTRMISRILRNKGYTVGTTTTHGIFINDECIEEGDTTGPYGAKRILNNREVDAAVLETARGGIIRDGLAYEKADVAVFTNLTQDHLGVDGINTMEDLLKVKSLVIEAVKDEGTCVLNADDPWIMKIKDTAKGNVILFTLKDDNHYVDEHIKNDGSAVHIRNGSICVAHKGMEMEVVSVNSIPATMNGGLKHNVYNSMAAIGAAVALNIPIEVITTTLKKFSCDAASNPGRFNVYDLEKFKVVLDYGHNIDGYSATIEGLRSLNPVRLIGIIGVPGDRRNEDIWEIGRLSGESLDRIIIKEDGDLRGRKPLEVADILRDGALKGGASEHRVDVVAKEAEALKRAMSIAESGDVIVVFFEKMEPLIKVIENYNMKNEEEESEVPFIFDGEPLLI